MDAVNIYPANVLSPPDRLDSASAPAGCRSGWMSSTTKASCWRPATGAAHQVRPRDAGPGGLLQWGGELRRHPYNRVEALRRVLIDYFPDDWLLMWMKPVTCSQLQAMYNGDQARKVLSSMASVCPVPPTTDR